MPTNTRSASASALDVYRWLENLEPRCEVTWMSAQEPSAGLFSGWVDVEVPMSGLDRDWIWTVTTGDDTGLDDGGELGVVAPYDIVVEVDRPSVADRTGAARSGGWTTGAITAAIADWVTAHTGRSDLRFVYVQGASPTRLADEATTEAIERMFADMASGS